MLVLCTFHPPPHFWYFGLGLSGRQSSTQRDRRDDEKDRPSSESVRPLGSFGEMASDSWGARARAGAGVGAGARVGARVGVRVGARVREGAGVSHVTLRRGFRIFIVKRITIHSARLY